MTPIGYPNREHENADNAAKRRALQALADVEHEAAFLRRAIERDGHVSADQTATLAQQAADVIRQFAVLGTLREVRKWHAAGVADGGR